MPRGRPKKAVTASAGAAVSSPAAAATTVVVNGTNSIGQPVVLPPSSPQAILNNLLVRDQQHPEEDLEPVSPTIIGLQNTVTALTNASSVEPYREHIEQVTANQPEKNEVIFSYVNQADHEYLCDLITMRHHAMRHMKRAIRRGDISSHEAIVIWQHADNRIPAIKKELKDNTKSVDTSSVVEKIDYHRQQVEYTVMKRWEGTTPQGRELIRKKLYKLKKEIRIQQGISSAIFEPPELAEDMPEDMPEDEASAEKKPVP